MKNSSVYILTQYSTGENRRVRNLLKLRPSVGRLRLVCEAGTGEDFDGALPVRKYPNLTGVFSRVGLRKLKSYLDARLYFPSPTMLYVWPAQRRLVNEIEGDLRQNCRVSLITSVPPHDLVSAGLHVKRRFPEVTWMVDWRDLWSFDENYRGRVPRSRRDRLAALEQAALRGCDVNIVTNDYARSVLTEHHGVSDDAVRTISHAYDLEDLDEIGLTTRRRRSNGPLQIGFLGNLLKPPKVPGAAVLGALAAARRRGVDLIFHIVGDRYLDRVSRRPVEGMSWVEIHENRPHRESLKLISSCDLLMLALANLQNCRAILPAKLPHYLLLGKPILAIAPESSAVADVIRSTGSGYVIASDLDWEPLLLEVLRNFREFGCEFERNEVEIEEYSWARSSNRWLSLINEVCLRRGEKACLTSDL